MERNIEQKITHLYNLKIKIVELLNLETMILEELSSTRGNPPDNNNSSSETFLFRSKPDENRQQRINTTENFKLPQLDFGVLCSNRKRTTNLYLVETLKDLSAKYNVRILCFSIDDVDLDNTLVNGTVITGHDVRKCLARIPLIIYNVMSLSKITSIKTIRQLRILKDVTIVNPVNRFNQAIMFEIISALPDANDCLLPFAPLTPDSIIDYLQQYGSIYLLPEKSSNRPVIILVEKYPVNGQPGYCIHTDCNKQYCKENEIYKSVKKMFRDKKHFIMKSIKTLNWHESPLECRVYVQRDMMGDWNITEMLAITDMFSNSYIYKGISDKLTSVLEEILPPQKERLVDSITDYSLTICTYLERFLPNLGSCILDFIIEEEGRPYFTYLGGWEQNRYLLNLGKREAWVKYIENMLGYMLFLKSKGEKKG